LLALHQTDSLEATPLPAPPALLHQTALRLRPAHILTSASPQH
jgi:hypothetical protein